MSRRGETPRKRALLSIRKKIGRIRGLVFFNSWVVAAGVMRKAPVIMRWGLAFEQGLGFTYDELGIKWRRFFYGFLPTPHLRAALCKRFCVVMLVLLNPLWAVLMRLEAAARDLDTLECHGTDYSAWNRSKNLRRRLDAIAKTIRFDGRPMTERSLTCLQRLSFGDWTCLGLMLVILASRAPCFELLRTWLNRQFALIFFLTCLRLELQGATRLLFQVLDRFIRRGVLCNVKGWPSSLQRFKRCLKHLRKFMRKMQRHHPGMTDEEALRVMHTLFLDPTNEDALSHVLDVRSPGSCLDVDTPDFALLIKRCRKQKYRNEGRSYGVAGLKVDSTVVELMRYFKPSPSEPKNVA